MIKGDSITPGFRFFWTAARSLVHWPKLSGLIIHIYIFMAQSHESSSSPRLTILIVDDDTAITTLYGTFLQERGYTVLKAHDPVEALQICKMHRGPIHFLLVDIVLTSGKLSLRSDNTQRPTMQGIALTRKLLALRPELQVIMCSGQPEEELNTLNVFKEKWPFLKKPFSSQTLMRMIQQIVDRQRPSTG